MCGSKILKFLLKLLIPIAIIVGVVLFVYFKK